MIGPTSTGMVYFNTRVRAMKSELYPIRRLHDLLDTDSVDALIEALLHGPYAQEMAESLTRYSGADAVEDAVSRNLSATLQKLVRIAPPDVRPIVNTLLLRWDLIAVKALLRARHVSAGGEAYPEGVLSGPSLTVPLLESLSRRDSMHALVSALTLWNAQLAGELALALPDYEEGGNLRALEDALDRAYYVREVQPEEKRSDENRDILRRLLRLEIDRINLRTLFTFHGTDELRQGSLLPDGTLPQRVLKAMVSAPDVTTAMEFLERTDYREMVERLYQYLQSHRFSSFERLFDAIAIRHCRELAMAEPFTIAVPACYVMQKYNEAMNFRLIARGEAGHLPRGRVLEEMVSG